MQGKKKLTQKLFYQVGLEELVPMEHFYRKLDKVINLRFLYGATKDYYGSEGQKSIDPVVFFKICLIGYLENIISDRKLVAHCNDSLAIRLFLRYDLDEQLPWHSTISRTRQLYNAKLFERVFQQILKQCIDAGLVAGHTQAIDSAFVKANASMDSLERKVPGNSLKEHLRNVDQTNSMDKKEPLEEEKTSNAIAKQKPIQADSNKIKDINTDQKKGSNDQNQSPGAGSKGKRRTSNRTHFSPTDPDAKMSVKPGKACKLNYYAKMAVDTGCQIITQIQADLADKHDSQCLKPLVQNTLDNLKGNGIQVENILADANYSSGENYAWLEEQGLKSYIPPHGTYKGGPEKFTFVETGNYWLCPNDKKVSFRNQKMVKNTLKNFYATTPSDCRDCPFKSSCLSKSQEIKRISITAYRAQYERNSERLKRDKRHKSKRMSTVEPVFGTLINFLGMRKVNTIGKSQAHKCMLMAACAFNLKKLLKYSKKPIKTQVNSLAVPPKLNQLAKVLFFPLIGFIRAQISQLILIHSTKLIIFPVLKTA